MQIPCRNRPPAHPVRYQRQKRNDKVNPQAGEVFFRCRQGQEGGSTPGISAPEGHLAGSTWIEMIVPSPKRARRRRSISTVSSCERATLIAPSTRTCTSTAIAAPMRRVRRLCGSPTRGSAVTIPSISRSVSSGNERSSSSPSPVRIRSKAILKIKTATTNAAMGSAMRHRCPRK